MEPAPPPGDDGGAEAAAPRPDGATSIDAVAFDTGKPEWRAIDKSVEKDLAALAKLAEGGRFGVASMTEDDKLWLVATDSPQHPGHYFLYDRAKKKGTFLFAVQPELDKQPLVDMQVVHIKTRDGAKDSALRAHAMRRSLVHFKCDNSAKV